MKRNITYVYIFEDNSVGISQVAPMPQDLEGIESGTLVVLRCVPNKNTGNADIKVVLENGELESPKHATPNCDEHGEYHTIYTPRVTTL